MSNIAKEILRNYVKEQNFKSTDEVLYAMKDMFKDTLQEVLEAEMDEHLGYDKHDLSEKQTKNRRNGYSKKISSLNLEKWNLIFLKIETGNLIQ